MCTPFSLLELGLLSAITGSDLNEKVRQEDPGTPVRLPIWGSYMLCKGLLKNGKKWDTGVGGGRDGRLHHAKWKANNMHISILRRCTTLLGKTKTKELSDTTVQSILHLSKCLSSSIEMCHSKRGEGGGKLYQSHSETTGHFVPFLQPTLPTESHLTQC